MLGRLWDVSSTRYMIAGCLCGCKEHKRQSASQARTLAMCREEGAFEITNLSAGGSGGRCWMQHFEAAAPEVRPEAGQDWRLLGAEEPAGPFPRAAGHSGPLHDPEDVSDSAAGTDTPESQTSNQGTTYSNALLCLDSSVLGLVLRTTQAAGISRHDLHSLV